MCLNNMESNNNKTKLKLFLKKPFTRGSASSDKSDLSLDNDITIPQPNRTQRIYKSIKKKFTRCKSKQKVTACEAKHCQTGFFSTEANDVIFNNTHSSSSQRIVSSLVDVQSPSVISHNCRNNLNDQENAIVINGVRISLGSNYDRTPPPVPPRSPSTLLSVRNSGSMYRPENDEHIPSNQYIYIVGQDEEAFMLEESNGSDARNNSFIEEYSNLLKHGYYWGPITRQEAEDKLKNQPDGTFLVRDSASQRYLFSLSFRSFGKTLHTRIEHSNGKFSISDNQEFNNIVELISQAMDESRIAVCCFSRSRTSMDPIYPVRLITPLSRFTSIRSLKHMCRFVIRQRVNINEIEILKLPKSVKDYLKEGYF